MKTEKSLKTIELLAAAVKAILAVRKHGGEGAFVFLLALLGLKEIASALPASVPAPTKLVVPPSAPTPIRTTSIAPGTIVSIPKPLPADKPAQVLTGDAPPSAPRPKFVPPPSGDFAAKLSGAAAKLGLEDKSLIGQFRFVLSKDGSGSEYWNDCRTVTAPILCGGLLEKREDWQLLEEKLKVNLFFHGGKMGEAFIRSCPIGLLADLATNQDGLRSIIGEIKEDLRNPSAPSVLWFVINICKAVGDEANGLMKEAKDAVNRLRMGRIIPIDHWLIMKVAAIKQPKRPSPVRGVQQPLTLPVSKKASEGAVEEPVMEVVAPAEENLPAPADLPPAELADDNGGKPPLDPEYEAEFKMLMEQEEASDTASAVAKILEASEPMSALESMETATASVN